MWHYYSFNLPQRKQKYVNSCRPEILFFHVTCRFMDPITFGDYPESMRDLVKDRLPKFTKEQSKLLKGSFDFLGLNYYTANYTTDVPNPTDEPPSYTTDSRATLLNKFKYYISFFLNCNNLCNLILICVVIFLL